MPSVEPFGDAAVLITLAEEASVETAARANALARHLRAAAKRAGRSWRSVVPGAASVLVQIGETPMPAALRVLAVLAAESGPGDDAWPADAPLVDVPVRYGGEGGPDLDWVAEQAGLTPAQVAELHASTELRALFLGFAPGFAYLGPLPAPLVLPRRATPRVRVPAGSVAIAGPYSAIYPIESPGGWHVLGRTDLTLWDPRRDPPALLEAGARVRFVSVRG
jgi:KipI family sensor histidine kinase inhibitor